MDSTSTGRICNGRSSLTLMTLLPSSNGDPRRSGDDLPSHFRNDSGGGQPRRGPLRIILDVLSSVRLGIVLLTMLFVYSSIGSAGVPIKLNIFDPAAWVAPRQWRWLEMTEFEWFHWW